MKALVTNAPGTDELVTDELVSDELVTDALDEAAISEIIEMALSDHTSFDQIRSLYGLREKEVKKLMRSHLKTGSYKVWRRRVRTFSDRRAQYK